MKTENEITDRHLAIHEAGHVVAYWMFEKFLPISFEYVTIEKSEDSLGHVQPVSLFKDKLDPTLFDFLGTDEDNREFAGFTQLELEAWLSIYLAGEAATYLETGERDDFGAGRQEQMVGDLEACIDLLWRLFELRDDPNAVENQLAHHYLEALFWRTVLLLSRPVWHVMVPKIADALIERRTLTKAECEDVAFETITLNP